jgi:type II secretory pathway component PulK
MTPRRPCGGGLSKRGLPPDHGQERGVAMILALVIVLILAALMLGLADTTTSEIGITRATDWDVRALYLAEAGIEHQIYALKANKNAGALGPVNYPVTPGQEYWYSTTLTCLLHCGVNWETQRWQIVSTGQVRLPGSSTVLQQRSLRAVVEIRYGGSGATLFQSPAMVTVLRREEVYP